jgi:hypothetical protein
MNIDTKSMTQHIMFWLLIAFIAGFGFSVVLERAHINPLSSKAFAPSENTVYCGPGGNAEAMGFYCGEFRSYRQETNPIYNSPTNTQETGPYGGGVPVLRDKNGNPIE